MVTSNYEYGQKIVTWLLSSDTKAWVKGRLENSYNKQYLIDLAKKVANDPCKINRVSFSKHMNYTITFNPFTKILTVDFHSKKFPMIQGQASRACSE